MVFGVFAIYTNVFAVVVPTILEKLSWAHWPRQDAAMRSYPLL